MKLTFYLKLLFLVQILASIQAAQTSFADDSKVPSWMKDRGDLLPPYDAKALDIMRKAWPYLGEQFFDYPSFDSKDEEKRYNQMQDAVRTLGKQAGLALIWIYADSPPTTKLNKDHFGGSIYGNRSTMLMRMRLDSSLVDWMVPLVKYRIAWVSEMLKSGRIEAGQIDWDEYFADARYLSIWSDPDEFSATRDVITQHLTLGFGKQIVSRLIEQSALFNREHSASERQSILYRPYTVCDLLAPSVPPATSKDSAPNGKK